jgi:hypothetical protein
VEEDEMGGACRPNGEKRNVFRLLVRKPEGKSPLIRLLLIIYVFGLFILSHADSGVRR